MHFELYETICSLLAEVTGEAVELSLAQRIWGLIVETINVINNSYEIKAVKQTFDRLDQAGAAA